MTGRACRSNGMIDYPWNAEWLETRKPSLFNICTDDLLRQLEQGGDGARIGSKYVGALAYADDITLLC